MRTPTEEERVDARRDTFERDRECECGFVYVSEDEFADHDCGVVV